MAAPSPDPSQAPPSARLEEISSISTRIEELSASDLDDYEDMGDSTGPEENAHTAFLESITSPIKDDLVTGTTTVQEKTLEALRPFLEGNPNGFPLNMFGLPMLQRESHVKYLKTVIGDYPAAFAAMDAARPWFVYWGLQGLTALGEDLSGWRDRVISTFLASRHPEGGYGGGFGQLPHLAGSYAAVLSLVMVGGEAAYDSIDRKGMWHFLGRMKQADGGFTVCPGGEEDIRGAFCVFVIMSLLNLPIELPQDAPARQHGHTTFVSGLGEWISRCQTYEGGISAAPGNEAHGAYAFCGLGCLSIMGPPETLKKHLDIPLLVHWLSSRQCAPECGYQGRTNKLVDGCYSHWIGGCWALVEAAAGANEGIWNRDALARYILSAAQFRKGGLIDKPGKGVDGYHTCYNLAGLSAAQHKYVYDEAANEDVGKGPLGAPFHWKADGAIRGGKVWTFEDLVEEVHPVFVIPLQAAVDSRRHFEGKEGF